MGVGAQTLPENVSFQTVHSPLWFFILIFVIDDDVVYFIRRNNEYIETMYRGILIYSSGY